MQKVGLFSETIYLEEATYEGHKWNITIKDMGDVEVDPNAPNFVPTVTSDFNAGKLRVFLIGALQGNIWFIFM